jgi:hypothetical protein
VTRIVALGVGALGLIGYAIVRIATGYAWAPSVVGCALGLIVLALLARGR